MSHESCKRCNRVREAKIHDTTGHKGTGTAAIHPFVGEREAVMLEFVAEQLSWSPVTAPAATLVLDLTAHIHPTLLSDYDSYWGQDA